MSQGHALLQNNREAWARKPVVRALYRRWYERLFVHLTRSGKPTLEIGAGAGTLKQIMPNVFSTDVMRHDWLDAVVDAHFLPFAEGSLANIVMVDVLHHLAAPARFFEAANGALQVGGRIVMLEPYISPFSRVCYSLFHQEEVRMDVDPLAVRLEETFSKDPFHGNGAIPSLIFWGGKPGFERRYRDLRVIHRERLSLVAYPLSGGFKSWSLIPPSWIVPLLRCEEAVEPAMGPWMAFRCLIVIEKRGSAS